MHENCANKSENGVFVVEKLLSVDIINYIVRPINVKEMYMKRYGFIALSALALSPALQAKQDVRLIDPRIVGGEEATQGDYPWMSALVYTGETITSNLTVGDTAYSSQPFNFTPSGSASGVLVDCGIGDQACTDAQDKVCLIERGEINFSEKADNCEAGGGVGVIIYNNVAGAVNGTLGEDFAGTIPVVGISQEDGRNLKENNLGDVANVEVSSETSLIQDSFCGASFLGDKWVLTAAHCIDDVTVGTLKVNVGEHDLSDGAENAITVKRIYMHPGYDDFSLNNDMALLELEESVDAEAISLASVETTDQAADIGSQATVMGWGGRIGYQPGQGPTGDFPDVLHEVDINLLTNMQCQQILSDSLTGGTAPLDQVGITDVMICATVEGGGKSSCQGDSGGPLVIDTNEGWQQVGVVSWGYGCAADGFPGVFARVAEFDAWLNGIYKGVAVDQTLDIHVVAANAQSQNTVEVVNNSDQAVSLTYSITGSEDFSVEANQCLSLAADEVCELTINYNSDDVGTDEAQLVISADDASVAVSSTVLKANAIATSEDVVSALGSDENVQWYSGGELPWVANTVDGGVESGAITDLQDSIVMAVVSGEGEFTFEWAVSSEENVDEPNEPYDALYIYINGQLEGFISGEVDYTSVTLELTGDENRITWIYNKDPNTLDGEDKGYLRNVVFERTPEPEPEPTPAPTPTPSSSGSSGGGSMAWLLAFASLLLSRRLSR
ncbi:MAG: trypsin [Colwelliaceae bacterium]|nr:trypsin [Colwelliaceae bacterium]